MSRPLPFSRRPSWAPSWRVDAAVVRFAMTVARLRLSVLTVFAALYGVQIVLSVKAPAELVWLAPTGAALLAAWAFLCWQVARRSWPRIVHLADVIQPFGLRAAIPLRMRHLAGLVAVMAVPGWIGLLGAIVFASLVVHFPWDGRTAFDSLRASLSGLAVLFAGCALVGPSGLDLVPFLSAGAALAVAGGLYLVSIVLFLEINDGRKPGGVRMFTIEQRSLVGAVPPLALLAFPDAGLALVLAGGMFVVIPLAVLLVNLLSLRGARADARRSLDTGDIRMQLRIGDSELLGLEDVVRESDGYFRLCAPHFARVDPTRARPGAGPRGIIGWIGGGDDGPLPSALGDVLVFRNLGCRPGPFLRLHDDRCTAARRALIQAAPDLDLPGLEQLRDEFDDEWDVRLMSASVPAAVGKLPWEQHELVVIPAVWAGTLVYPPGTGLHDGDGLPCHLDAVQVRVQIRPAILRAAADPDAADAAGRELLAALLANHRRILPGVYETMHTCLVRELRRFALPLLFEHEDREVLAEDTLKSLPQTLTRTVVERLPQPLARLVEVQVLSVAQPDTTILSDQQRQTIERLRTVERNKSIERFRKLNDLMSVIREYLYKSSPGDGRLAKSTEQYSRRQGIVLDIQRAAEECRVTLNSRLQQAGAGQDTGMTDRAVEAITESYQEFRASYLHRSAEMEHAFQGIQEAFLDKSDSAH
ncbi:hypothetical protein [Azospirillum agricola]|uniref:hypothetical protein n=1 Tax=Azospirillum agricola TaxID=1720247 RepID=UPI000A0EF891|nr:hypothetical protein [Azospirillum agricola]SMH47903.1 hypothetical protein SAMN02982994_2677 [Azospirillum lipoferum]